MVAGIEAAAAVDIEIAAGKVPVVVARVDTTAAEIAVDIVVVVKIQVPVVVAVGLAALCSPLLLRYGDVG